MTEASKLTGVMTRIVELLSPLEADERGRIVRAALALLGEPQNDVAGGGQAHEGDAAAKLPSRAITWMRQHSVSSAQLEQLFHMQSGQVEVIASDVPGNGKKGKTINAFVLQGIRGLLVSGEPAFDDKASRQLCKNLGCYDEANHAINIKAGGNLWVGSKEKGWQLTGPGLKYGADLVRQMAP
jgi:hypothetical protein